MEDSEIKPYPLFLGKASKESVKVFSVDYNAFGTSNILNIHRYLMKETWYKIMFVFILKMYTVLLTNIDSASNHTKCVPKNERFNLLLLIFPYTY